MYPDDANGQIRSAIGTEVGEADAEREDGEERDFEEETQPNRHTELQEPSDGTRIGKREACEERGGLHP